MRRSTQLMLPGMESQASPRAGRRRRPVDEGRANRNEVYETTQPRHSGDQQRIIEYLTRCGDHGATRDEIAIALAMPLTTVSGRVTELKRLGDVQDTAERRPTRTGSTACVLTLAMPIQRGAQSA